MPPERITLKGFSLLPLNENGWLVGPGGPYRLALGRRSDNPDESSAILAVLTDVGSYDSKAEFVKIIKDNQAKDNDPQRFAIKQHDVSAINKFSTVCVRSHTLSIDNAASRRSGNTGDMTLEILSLSCAHPADKTIVVTASYSQRYYPGRRGSDFDRKAQAVLDSLEFNDVGDFKRSLETERLQKRKWMKALAQLNGCDSVTSIVQKGKTGFREVYETKCSDRTLEFTCEFDGPVVEMNRMPYVLVTGKPYQSKPACWR